MRNDLLRYSCQVSLDGFGIEGQSKLKKSKVLIIGAGGLGCPVSQYLAAAGVGTIGIADHDTVALRNLHRQILFGDQDIGALKVTVAAARLKEQNPNSTIIPFPKKITSENVLSIIKPFDLIIDCTDNFYTRYLLNDACVITHKPLIYGAIFQFEGQAAIWNVKNSNGKFSSNYRDIFPSVDDTAIPNCETGGVIPTIAGIIGSIQATEAIKYITGIGDLLINRLFIFDGKTMKSCIINLPKTTSTKITQLQKQKETPVISSKDLKQFLNEGSCRLIDVRSEREHKESNIGGENIPLEEFLNSLDRFTFDETTVIYCRSGARSSKAVKHILTINKHAKVFNLEGGILSYSASQG